MAEKDGTLILELVDTTGAPLSEKVDVRLRHRVLTEEKRISNLKASPLPRISKLRRSPQGLYSIEIDPPSYRAVQNFLNIPPSGDNRLRLVFPVDPRKVRDVRFPLYAKLSAELQRILEASNEVLGAVGRTGRDLYAALDPLSSTLGS